MCKSLLPINYTQRKDLTIISFSKYTLQFYTSNRKYAYLSTISNIFYIKLDVVSLSVLGFFFAYDVRNEQPSSITF